MLLVLTQAEIFSGVPRRYLAALAERSSTRVFRVGSQLMRQGEAAKAMYIIVSGRVRVENPRAEAEEALAELGPSEAVGEMGVLDAMPRSATVTAIEDTVTVELTAAAISETLQQFPEAETTLLRVLRRRPRTAEESGEPSGESTED